MECNLRAATTTSPQSSVFLRQILLSHSSACGSSARVKKGVALPPSSLPPPWTFRGCVRISMLLKPVELTTFSTKKKRG